ncbi:dynamin [Metapseudomonas lalkuanensis]|uniref:Dynamin n=1 Tax=Metapseudomonas lalkuanensis TaxID=2604832 RepID=A0A5J6QR74_9GAMM|nr:dynamin family protein [Pseudomonas lalkuanensis]QEY64993.1 dynamin [Pseudomonas lalkuanensis]
MHENSITILQEEARRLLDVEIDLLERMQAEPGVVVEEQDGGHQTFSRDTIGKDIEMLRGERAKLESLEMVLAVVGTMKAGKSTTINAIVGTEVLPNRNRPMTALPTLIRHTPEQLEPLLRLDNNAPINDLLGQLYEVCRSPAGQQALDSLEHTDDMLELLGMIQRQERFGNRYEGPEAIFDFLKNLNDLVRLSAALDVEFPFSSYGNVHELPVIEVRFAHLSEMTEAGGRLTLLDTPGPNESGQPHLRKMLQDQLKKASAVLAVLDFTQLKSEADEQVRQELEIISETCRGRMYAVVNKFDQKDRHGDSAEQIQAFVADTLMGRRLKREHVFPVSSRWGYLANRARHELANGRGLSADHAWVADFGELVLGMGWEESIDNAEEVLRRADMLWKKSLFSAPLDNVIRMAHGQAATLAIASAASKLVDIASRLNRFLEVRDTALAKSSLELEEQINSLLNDVEQVKSLESESQEKAKKVLEEIHTEMGEIFDAIRKGIEGEIEAEFKAGKASEKKQAKARADAQKSLSPMGVRSLFRAFWGFPERDREGFGYEFDESHPLIALSSKEEAETLVKAIENGVQKIIADGEKIMAHDIEILLGKFRESFSQNIKGEANELIKALNERFNRSGFAVDIRLPDTAPLSFKYSASELLGEVIDSRRRPVTRYRRSSGAWGTICSWFNTSDWGWESYETTEGYFEVDINKIKKRINGSVDMLFEELLETTSVTIKAPLETGVHQFFEQLKYTLENIRSDLAQSLLDKQNSRDEQQALAQRLAGLKRNVPAIQRDSEELKNDVQPSIEEAVA